VEWIAKAGILFDGRDCSRKNSDREVEPFTLASEKDHETVSSIHHLSSNSKAQGQPQ